MNTENSIIDYISGLNHEIIETAQNVNSASHTRKQITSEILMLLSELMDKNIVINTNFRKVAKNLEAYIESISKNLNEFKSNVKLFKNIISNIDNIKINLDDIANQILEMINIVDSIKKDTEEINVLATNASIVSSKYHKISSVFEILSAKLNSMSIYITQNLEHIVQQVRPIKNGIDKLKNNNSLVLADIGNGHNSFSEFYEQLNIQETVVVEQVRKAETSESKIQYQKKMLEDINNQVIQMDSDAGKAIEGSGHVIKIGELLNEAIMDIQSEHSNWRYQNGYIKKIDFITEQSETIWSTAQNVNTKSKSQLEFSFSSLEFCKTIIGESKELEKTVSIFNKQSIENNELTTKIGASIKNLLSQLNEIELRMISSNETLKKFTDDYFKIYNIMSILKNILRLMKIIGIYSKIEASRDPVTFDGFLTISKNIQKLQNNIKDTLPGIEKNIKDTQALIDIVNDSYQKTSSEFYKIRESANSITHELDKISQLSEVAEKSSKEILEESLNLDTLLNDLENYLIKLTEVVKIPIEGSAGNIGRGKMIEKKSKELKNLLLDPQTTI